MDSESTEKKEDTIDGGENDSEIAEGIPFEEDYHDSMDGESYKCYFEKSTCQNILKHSVIVIDNAPYHSKNTENYPISKWRKQQFVDWLREKNITFPDKALTAELWTLVRSEREKFPDKVMETVAKEYRHEILPLPPYHCELNPIELAWAAEKTMQQVKTRTRLLIQWRNCSGKRGKSYLKTFGETPLSIFKR